MTNRSKTPYTGVTGHLERRVFEHKQGKKGEFAARYKIDRLVYFEGFGGVHAAIAREKQIKDLLRIKEDCPDRIHEPGVARPERSLVHSASISAREYIDPSSGAFRQAKDSVLRMTTPFSHPQATVILSAVCRLQSKRQSAKDLCIWNRPRPQGFKHQKVGTSTSSPSRRPSLNLPN